MEHKRLSAEQMTFFAGTCQTIQQRLRPAWISGQLIARTRFPLANSDQFIVGEAVHAAKLYADTSAHVPVELSPVEARWFVEGYVQAWQACCNQSPRHAISQIQQLLVCEFGDVALLPVTIGYNGAAARAEATLIVDNRTVHIWSDKDMWIVMDDTPDAQPQPSERGMLRSHLL